MENPFNTIIEKIAELDSKVTKLLETQESLDSNNYGELMNIKELSDFLDESVQSIYSRTSKRTIPFYKKGKKLLFKKNEILDWLDKKKTVFEIMEEI